MTEETKGKIAKGKLSDFRPLVGNPNQHTERGTRMLDDAMGEVGYTAAMTAAADGEILDGSLRLETAIEKFGDDVIVVETDGKTPIIHVRTDIPNARTRLARRAIVGANRIHAVDFLEDADVMAAMLAEDESVFEGLYRDDELEELLGDLLGGDEVEDPGAQVDRAGELQEKWGVKLGDVWEIPSRTMPGKCHRVMCGDSTDEKAVARLMEGIEQAQLFATDPPYGANAGNIGFTAQRDDIEAITKDDLEGVEMQAFLEKVFAVWIPYLKDDCAWYLWHPMLTQGYFAAAAAAADLIIHRQIIWKKEQFIFGRGDYHWRHELCFYGWRKGRRPPFYGERNQDTVWEVPWGMKRSEVGHPTAKPPELFARPMRNHLRRGDICIEPFCGSGSQIVAAEGRQVRCLAMETIPKFVAITLERLAGMGLEPCLLA